MENKTASYTRKAVDKYRTQFDLSQIRLPKGTRERAKKHNVNINDIAVSAILAELERLESTTTGASLANDKNIGEANKIDSRASETRKKAYSEMTQEEINRALSNVQLSNRALTPKYYDDSEQE